MDEKDELPDEEAKKLSGLVPDIVRRAVLTGVGALFMTEEGIRNMVTDMKLPKDALAFLLSQADKTRTEVARVVTQEMRRFLESFWDEGLLAIKHAAEAESRRMKRR